MPGIQIWTNEIVADIGGVNISQHLHARVGKDLHTSDQGKATRQASTARLLDAIYSY